MPIWNQKGVYLGNRANAVVGIVTSGLVLNLDAGNSASYPGSGTTWSDLSGNGNNGTLVNSPTFNSGNSGYLSFDGVNDHVTFSYVQPAYGTSTSFTWNVWIYPTVNNTNVVMGNRGTDLVFTKLTPSRFEYYPTYVGDAMPLNTWQNVCVVKDGTNFTYYRNSASVATATDSGTKVSKPFYVGGDPTAGEYATARISVVNVYNRALSAAEITQNFNAFRVRYGI